MRDRGHRILVAVGPGEKVRIRIEGPLTIAARAASAVTERGVTKKEVLHAARCVRF